MDKTTTASIPEAYKLAQAHFRAGRLKKAESICHKVLAAMPGHPRSLHLMGLLCYKKGAFEDAEKLLVLAVQGRPKLSHFQNDLGASLSALGKHEQALAAYVAALELAGSDDTESLPGVYRNIAIALQHTGRINDALEYHARALEINPDDVDAIWNRCHIYLAQGDFKKGWEGYEQRLHLKSYKKTFERHRNVKHRWDGRPFPDKTLLIQDEQGLGDSIQFIRLAPLVKALGGKVVVETRGRIKGLLSSAAGFDEIVTHQQAEKRNHEFDLHVPLLSLPGLLNIRMDVNPLPVPYLKAEQERAQYWKQRINGNGLKVGLVWTGNLENLALRHRSIDLSKLAPYLNIPGITLYSLQFGETTGHIARIPASIIIHDIGKEVVSFGELAAASENLDLIITVDTAMAHLAGALGRPTWMLLSFPPDWRWMIDRDDHPWYPTMRIFRQQKSNQWQPVFEKLGAALAELALESKI